MAHSTTAPARWRLATSCFRATMKNEVLVAAALLVSGCANFSGWDSDRGKQFDEVDQQSAFPVTRRSYFERINILELIDPEQGAKATFAKAWKEAEKKPEEKDDLNQYGAWYDLTFAYFRQRNDITPQEKQRRRNSIQERIISASVSRCNVFKTYLRRQQTDVNFNYGSATTAAGALGAIVSGQTATRALSGTAGLFSGLRAEYNQHYFANLTAQVIVKGIDLRQAEVYRQIQEKGQTKSIDDYPLEAAIRDAVYFDGLCSTVVGLTQAAIAVDQSAEPGLEAVTRTILKARLAQEAAHMPREQILNAEALKKFEQAAKQVGVSLIGSSRGEPVASQSEKDPYMAAKEIAEVIARAGKGVGATIEQAALEKRGEFIDDLRKRGNTTGADNAQNVSAGLEGKVKEEVGKAIDEKLIKPLNFALCYAQLVAPAVLTREQAIQDLAKAPGDMKRKLAVDDAIRGVEAAHAKLKLRENALNADLERYRSTTLADIKAKMNLDDLKSVTDIVGTPTPEATKGLGCTAPS